MLRHHLRRRTLALAAATAAGGLGLTACGPSITSDDDDGGGSDALRAPDTDAPSGEITIWDRSGDLFEVFKGVIDDFNALYPDIKVNHVAVDIDAKLQNTLITGADVPDGVF